jgi:shikimate dehydrogenase
MTISGTAKLAGVMGWPVAQSRSPLMHNHWISTLGMEAAYIPMPVKPEDLETALRALPKLGFRGVNLTVPHKEAALRMVDSLDAAARRTGAVNTIVVKDDGSLEGRNTDVYGFAESLDYASGSDSNVGTTAVVLGAGGAARAVIAALIDEKVRLIRITNRTIEKAQAIADAMRTPRVVIEVIPWDDRSDALDGASLVVNTTLLGMRGQPTLEIDLAALSQGAIVADIVYAPLETPLLTAARELGLTTLNGLRMLIEQARPGFEAWFGELPPVTPELIEMLEFDLKAKRL